MSKIKEHIQALLDTQADLIDLLNDEGAVAEWLEELRSQE